jgi:hypothetical protein
MEGARFGGADFTKTIVTHSAYRENTPLPLTESTFIKSDPFDEQLDQFR